MKRLLASMICAVMPLAGSFAGDTLVTPPATLGTPVAGSPPAILLPPIPGVTASPTRTNTPAPSPTKTHTPAFANACPTPSKYPIDLGGGAYLYLMETKEIWPPPVQLVCKDPSNPHNWLRLCPDGRALCYEVQSVGRCYECDGKKLCEYVLRVKGDCDQLLPDEITCALRYDCLSVATMIVNGEIGKIQAILSGQCGEVPVSITGSCDPSGQNCKLGVTCCGPDVEAALNLLRQNGIWSCEGSATWRPDKKSCFRIDGSVGENGSWGVSCKVEIPLGPIPRR